MKEIFALCLFLVTTHMSFSFAEDLPSGVFSMQECRECLRKFYRFEAIDEKLLASSAEKLENIIFSFLKDDIETQKNNDEKILPLQDIWSL